MRKIFQCAGFLLVMACDSPSRQILFSFKDRTETIRQKKVVLKECHPKANIGIEDTLSVQLIEYPGRGYAWIFATPDSAMQFLTLVAVERIQIKDLDGSPDMVEFLFTGIRQGEQMLSFNYLRPWEKNKPPFDICQVLVFVGKTK